LHERLKDHHDVRTLSAIAGAGGRPYRIPQAASIKTETGGNTMQTTRKIAVNGLDMAVREQGTGPLVILCHGWPELSFSWRHQIGALADAGYRVVAPDMRGFGGTTILDDPEASTIFHTVGDMVALVTALGETQAAIIGHDWGAPVAWHAAMFRPDMFKAVAGLSVPPPLRGRSRPLEALRSKGITNFYWQYFQTPGIAEAEFERDVDFTMRAIFSAGFSSPDLSLYVAETGFLGNPNVKHELPAWISEAELAEFVRTYQASGFRGGMNWYRNLDRNWDLTAPWQDAVIAQPSLFIAGGNDSVVTGLMGRKRIEDMHVVLTGLTNKIILEGAGHWIQQERPAEVNAAIVEFLNKTMR
jgi:pimeloyl-ACP methyl ester carboxylesterase